MKRKRKQKDGVREEKNPAAGDTRYRSEWVPSKAVKRTSPQKAPLPATVRAPEVGEGWPTQLGRRENTKDTLARLTEGLPSDLGRRRLQGG